MSTSDARPEGADRSRPSLETTKGEAAALTTAAADEDWNTATKALYAARLLAEGYGKTVTAQAMQRASEAVNRLAARAANAALTDPSAGELVRLRDSQQGLEADSVRALVEGALWVAAIETVDISGRIEAVARWLRQIDEVDLWRLTRPKAAAPSSSVSPSLTEKDLVSGENRSAPDGGEKA